MPGSQYTKNPQEDTASPLGQAGARLPLPMGHTGAGDLEPSGQAWGEGAGRLGAHGACRESRAPWSPWGV